MRGCKLCIKDNVIVLGLLQVQCWQCDGRRWQVTKTAAGTSSSTSNSSRLTRACPLRRWSLPGADENVAQCSSGTWAGTGLVCDEGCAAVKYEGKYESTDCPTEGGTRHGVNCTVRCAVGFLGKDSMLSCEDQKWQGALPECVQACGSLHALPKEVNTSCVGPSTIPPPCLARFFPVFQYLLERDSGVWVLECGGLTFRGA